VPELEGRLVDPLDQPVPEGEQGELVVRPREPFVTTQGYWAMPEETIEANRNQWFHTGDLLRPDADGNLYFVGRTKDSIRRRGENVSAWEVEQAAMLHPDVLETAAIAVPSPLGEDDVALLVTVRPGARLSPPDLRAFVATDLPKFAVPRYVEFVASFPKTASERVDKGKVRATGLSTAAWDAEAPVQRS
jgi:crotonobetaine/carnitine-CoA ligase